MRREGFRQAWGASRLIRPFDSMRVPSRMHRSQYWNLLFHRHLRLALVLAPRFKRFATCRSSALLPWLRAYYGFDAQTSDRVSTSLYKLGLARTRYITRRNT